MPLDLLQDVQEALASRYAVEQELGRGGMACVFRARDQRDGRPVALKVLYPDLAKAVGGERFLREIQILSKLSHPHILPLLDSGAMALAPGLLVPWYVMPLVEGESLRGRLTREGPLPLADALQLAGAVAAALAHAHARGFVHRDIKPENILLADGVAVVADFGIARAVTVAGGGTLTSTGLVVGTPAYMSPEQAAGSANIDGRSDLYSIGVVLYEMLAGHPPFTGTTPQALGARHQFELPPPIRVVRPSIPVGVERLITRLLAKVPADRLATAVELTGELARVSRDPELTGAVRAVRRTRSSRVVIAAAGLLAALGAVGTAVRSAQMRGVEPERILVLPFLQEGTIPAGVLGGVDAAMLIEDALGGWPDLPRIDGLRVQNAIASAGAPRTLSDGERLARSLGAGRLVWGRVFRVGDSIRVEAVLYRVGWLGSRTVAADRLGLPPAATADDSAAARHVLQGVRDLARGLLALGEGGGAEVRASLETTRFGALKAKLAGDAALARWDLRAARQGYRSAVTLDPGYPQAHLALAQLGSWTGRAVEEWRPDLDVALRTPARLTPRQRAIGTALLAMAEDRFPDACAEYRKLLAADSTDFAAQFGLGECQANDPVVVRSSASESGWGFRGDYAAGLRAYQRAMDLVPLVHQAFADEAITRLLARFYAEASAVRLGYAAGADTAWFAAFPQVRNGELRFVPRARGEVLAGRWPGEYDPTANALGRRALRATTLRWVGAFPGSVAAWRAHAIALELAGNLGETGDPAASAPGAVRAARRLPTGGREALELACMEVRIALKALRFRAAASLADSLLRTELPVDPEEARWLAGLAALRGAAPRAAELLARSAAVATFTTPEGAVVTPPAAIAEDALRLLAYAVVPGADDSLAAVHDRLRDRLQRELPSRMRGPVSAAVLNLPQLLAFPALGAPSGAGFLRRAEQAFSAGERTEAKEWLAQLQRVRSGIRAGDVSPDFVVAEARLALALGDTAGAERQLGNLLRDLPSKGLDLVTEVPQAAALVTGLKLGAAVGTGPQQQRMDSLFLVLTDPRY